MKTLFPVATAIAVALCLGIVIGRKTAPEAGNNHDSGFATAQRDDYRSTQRNSGSSDPTASRPSNASKPSGGSTQAGNQLKQMTTLAKKARMGRGIPDFDALFGIWEIARDMSVEEVEAALRELQNSGLLKRENTFINAILVMQWAKKDGHTAMRYALENPGNSRFFPMKQIALQSWASSDHHGAYTWYETNRDQLKASERKNFETYTINALAQDNFPLAFEKAKKVDSTSRKDVLRNLGATVANNPQQRQQFVQYLMTLESKEIRNETAETIASSLAMEDPSEAVKFVNEWPGDDRSGLADGVARQWGQTEPRKALEWRINMTSENEDTPGNVDNIFGSWAREDTPAARTWLESRQDIDQDQFRESAARRLMWNDDHAEAANWAASISDADKRERSYKRIYRRWNRDDPEGARKWLATQDAALQQTIAPAEDNE